MTKVPFSSVTTSRFTWVSTFCTATAAPGSTPRDEVDNGSGNLTGQTLRRRVGWSC